MALPNVNVAFFEAVESDDSGWRVRVALGGDGFVDRAAPVIATVGDVPVEAIAVSAESATGFLSTVPPPGAPLRVGYLDTGLHDTGITFPDQPNV